MCYELLFCLLCVLTTLFLFYDYIGLLEHIMSLSNEFDASSDMDFMDMYYCGFDSLCLCACVFVGGWVCVGVGVVVMNDWSHSDTRAQTQSAQSAAGP